MRAFVISVFLYITLAVADDHITLAKTGKREYAKEVTIDLSTIKDITELYAKHADKMPCLRACVFKKNPTIVKIITTKEPTYKDVIDRLKAKLNACGNDWEYWKCLEVTSKSIREAFGPSGSALLFQPRIGRSLHSRK